jgi:DNA-binding Lrp family transcriptional regulator
MMTTFVIEPSESPITPYFDKLSGVLQRLNRRHVLGIVGVLTYNFVMTTSDDSESDERLLSLLRENARASVATLARRLGVPRTTVQSRIERLERRGVIAGYTVKTSDSHERRLIRAHVLITALPKLAARVEGELRRMPAVRALHSVSGAFDMIAIVAAATVEDLERQIDRIGALDGVERTMSSIILSTRIDR